MLLSLTARVAVMLFTSNRCCISFGLYFEKPLWDFRLELLLRIELWLLVWGSRTHRIDMWTFGLGSGVAGLGGVSAFPAR